MLVIILALCHIYLYNRFESYQEPSFIFRTLLSFFALACPQPEQWEDVFWLDIPSQQVFSFHKSNERHVHRQTKCHRPDSDPLPGLQWKTETSRKLAHICFLWRRWTKVMKSLGMARWREGKKRGRERIKRQCGSNKRAIDKPSSIRVLALENKMLNSHHKWSLLWWKQIPPSDLDTIICWLILARIQPCCQQVE